MSYNNDKREILKLKQGLIEDSEVIQKEETEKVELRGKKKAENFWYHYKIHVLMVLFFGVLISFFAADIFLQKRPDIGYLVIASDEYTSIFAFTFSGDINEALTSMTPNFDENRYVYAEEVVVDLYNVRDNNGVMAAQTKLFAEIQTGTRRLIFANRGAFDRIIGGTNFSLDEIFVDLSELYPDSERITENIFFELYGSEFSRITGEGEFFPEDFYVALLSLNLSNSRQERAHERALTVLDNIVYGRIIE
jgi:hypothetical protein